jgi:hypothetical protein
MGDKTRLAAAPDLRSNSTELPGILANWLLDNGCIAVEQWGVLG